MGFNNRYALLKGKLHIMNAKNINADTGVTVKGGVITAACMAVVLWFGSTLIDIKTELVMLNVRVADMEKSQSDRWTKADQAIYEQKRARQMGTEPLDIKRIANGD
jgi:hypothetical protein